MMLPVARNSFWLVPFAFPLRGVLGSTNIMMRASEYRPGFRISSSASDRFYKGRFMATYSSGMQENGWAFTLSSSRRWAQEAYTDGTLYDAWSLFGAVEYRFNEKNSIQAIGIFAPNRRGSSAAITREVFELTGESIIRTGGYRMGTSGMPANGK